MQDFPIPGENYTSDTKSYPWHNPPEFVAIGPALDKMSQKLTDRKTAPLLMSMVETGLPLYKLSQIIIMEGMMNGKWTLDLGLLLAGPICKILEIICTVYDVPYELGIEDDDDEPTGLFAVGVENLKKGSSNNGAFKVVQDEMASIKEEAETQEIPEGAEAEGGFAGGSGEEDLGKQGFATMMTGSPEEEGAPADTEVPEAPEEEIDEEVMK